MDIDFSFPSGKKINAEYNGYVVKTDFSKSDGGEESAPTAYSLFLASIGACAGAYVLDFCHSRGIDTKELKMHLRCRRSEKTHLAEQINLQIDLPQGFPEKYKSAVIKAANQCTVKRNIITPPQFSITADINPE
jgi:ribosomal protein S12 methylthiotransferase accessory factor